MRRRLPIIDILVYGGLGLFAVIAAIIAFVTPQEWDAAKLGILIGVCGGMLVLCIVVLLSKALRRPSYITKQGVAVYAVNEGTLQDKTNWSPTELDVVDALDFFVRNLPRYLPEVHENDLINMLKDSVVEFQEKPVGAIGIGWLVKDKAGLQQGKAMLVQWPGTIARSAFFHELMHMVDECCLQVKGWKPDYEHTKEPLWDAQAEVLQGYIQECQRRIL